MVKNLRVCNMTDFAISFSWDPLDGSIDTRATHYRVRYTKDDIGWGGDSDWFAERFTIAYPEKERRAAEEAAEAASNDGSNS